MKARLRTTVAALVCLAAGSPALAQQTPSNTTAPAQNGVVGPSQLQNFSINGTVTKPATTPPAEERAQPPQQRPGTASSSAPATAQTQTQPRTSSRSGAQVPTVETPRNRPNDQAAEITAAPPPVVTQAPPTVSDSIPVGEIAPSPRTAEPVSSNGISFLPWLIAALALAGGGAWFFLRRRPRESFAGAGNIDLFDAPLAPTPAPRVDTPPPAPAAPAPELVPTGVVSTRLRPWLEIELNPDRGVIDDEKAAVAFELSVYNSGSVAARDVALEATLFAAGPSQDQQIQLFFDNPVGKGDPIPVIPPMKRATVNTVVFIARDKVRPIEVEGRSLFVPVIAVNALYSWGRTKAQTSASYVVGKQTSGEKLAPFRLDLGRRIFRGLAAREHELKVRK
jgi:hypothetical protein